MTTLRDSRANDKGPRETFASHIDLRNNALNLVRLVLASSVMVWHSFTLTGNGLANTFLAQLLSESPVDGFFAISGFLLCASWLRKPALGPYLRNRFLRLVPAYWTSLLLVAFVAAPVSQLLTSAPVGDVFHGSHSAGSYVLHNLALQVRFYDIAGTPSNIPYSHVWNGSAWTLVWEAYAYLGLATVALLTLLRRRLVMVVLTVLAWAVMAAQSSELIRHNFYLDRGSRLGFMFLCGVLLYLYRDRVPATRVMALAAAAVLVVSTVLSDYRLLGGPALAYLVMWVGGAIRRRGWQLQSVDVSYGMYIYAFPVQQMLVLAGLGTLAPPLFAVVSIAATTPLALASWFVVERPALRLKRFRLPIPRVGPGQR